MCRFLIIIAILCVSCQKDELYTGEGNKVRDKANTQVEYSNINVVYETDYDGEIIFEF